MHTYFHVPGISTTSIAGLKDLTFDDKGPVVQNIVSLMLSLSPQFINYYLTSKAHILLFFVEKM